MINNKAWNKIISTFEITSIKECFCNTHSIGPGEGLLLTNRTDGWMDRLVDRQMQRKLTGKKSFMFSRVMICLGLVKWVRHLINPLAMRSEQLWLDMAESDFCKMLFDDFLTWMPLHIFSLLISIHSDWLKKTQYKSLFLVHIVSSNLQ